MNSRQRLMFGTVGLLMLAGCGTREPNSAQVSAPTADVQVITLTQTGCQFLEPENQDYQFTTTQADDCQQINATTLSDRQQRFQPLQLPPGDYIFQVTNRDVPYELGFYLRGDGLSQATLPKVSGGGMTQGVTQEYRITLKPGRYVFSCPLNPTPDYPLVVQ
jgi:hypothetical protein